MKARNYARFYTLLNRLPTTDRDELKATLVSQYTGGRTESLREMTTKEYDAMCDAMQQTAGGYRGTGNLPGRNFVGNARRY